MIVITGAGILSSLGIGVDTTLQALQSGACGIAPPRHLTTQHPLPVGEVPMSNAELSEAVQAASDVTSRTALMGIMALGEALQSAQLSSADLPHLALVGGTTVGNMDVTEVEFARTLHADTLGLCGMCTDQIAAHFGEWGYVTTL
ncbi:MAG: beta-ketoacyl-[acyl-carrier-protein] synthase family protein, partial [Alloprevotella sp.]|nr:beta-ketoacyl-[acyl-carrier-protein] synthase family protein [Alloprevotella sp.]